MDNLFAAFTSIFSKEKFQHNIRSITNDNNLFFKNKEIVDIELYSHCFSYYSFNKNLVKNFDQLTTNIDFDSVEKNSDIELLANCRIDNKDQLLPKSFAQNISVKKSDTENDSHLSEMFTLLYSKFEDDLPKHLKGNFTYILWDKNKEELHAAIDAFSGRSLFYLQINDEFYIASDAKVLASHPSLTLTVNKQAIVQWLSGRPDPNISMYNEIKRLPCGHQLIWRNNKVSVSKFWDIEADKSIRYKNTDEYKQHFYDVLMNSVSNRLVTSSSSIHSQADVASVFCQMSGGMDSTSIAALANIETKRTGLALHTLSHSYKNTESCNEMDNINDMIEKLNLSHAHFVELDKFDEINFGQLYPTDFDSPGIVLSPKYHEELSLIQQLGATTLLTGNGGDEICWGHSSTYRSRLYKGEVGVINEVVKACAELNEPVASSLVKLFVKPLIPNSLQNLLRLALNKPRINATDNPTSAWLTEEALGFLDEDAFTRSINNPFNKTFEPAKHARFHSLKTTSTYNSMRSYQKVANSYGIDVRHPFFDVDVVEFSFAIPDRMLIQGSYPKWLLRKTMEDHLPESVVWNKHKTVFDHHFANLVRSNEDELRELLSHSGLHDLGLLDNDVLMREFDELVRDPNRHLNVDMLYAILTQSWYQTHCV
ncbi:asparagine synthetase B family protein [Pseudocolwellia sp. HL-MZ19]|uniref:asparagine synthetase B family protein n=1 Tax=Pseudocolwellia sp. HL-MZ19 TaxID=3400846 RepID=UPI003CEE8BF9